MKPETFVFDIDGTLSRMCDRDVYDGEASLGDSTYEDVERLLRALDTTFNVVFVTARSERHRLVTEAWLALKGLRFGPVYMRADDDQRPDFAVKRDIVHGLLSSFYVLGVFEDNAECVDMYREEGFTAYLVKHDG